MLHTIISSATIRASTTGTFFRFNYTETMATFLLQKLNYYFQPIPTKQCRNLRCSSLAFWATFWSGYINDTDYTWRGGVLFKIWRLKGDEGICIGINNCRRNNHHFIKGHAIKIKLFINFIIINLCIHPFGSPSVWSEQRDSVSRSVAPRAPHTCAPHAIFCYSVAAAFRSVVRTLQAFFSLRFCEN